ncbi:F0F1 ATP synthase subunit B [Belliella aquatica]|uniref:ATP synthase subunit b n=1 Tax=Belliella aquatica TaxID=1323734 RepID=A0ABQ1NCV6_9BACT|nr:F0F1 ATP synthase subunit B [Belliella aquatica]MCH7407572.1 F0F1 ATP synthase subunit B [Belliella aquatica]GGC54879.1 ATP synthase subunit b [Belliella aquatica]
MDLILPSSGLIIWQLIGFLALLFILMKFAWKPILETLEERESSIDDALKAAERAKAEMANLKSENEKLLQEARIERDNILKTANDASAKMIEDAKQAAIAEGAKMIENAKAVIENEKKAALTEVKNQVAQLTLEVTDKLLRKNLSSQAAQQELVEGMVKDINLN